MTKMFSAELNVRRYDISENPPIEKVFIIFESKIPYNKLKEKVMNACNITAADNKIIKLRNSENMIIPYSMMLENNEVTTKYNVDITNITNKYIEGMKLIQNAHTNSVHSKLDGMKSRIDQVEMLLPELEWKGQAHIEETVNALSVKVSFLNRRFDEMLPQLNSKIQHTVS